MLKWPTLTEPGNTTESHIEPLRALKMIAELVTGQRAGSPVTIARVFRTDVRPGAQNSTVQIFDLRDNDLWIDTGNSNKLKFWDAATEVWIPTT